MFYRYEAMPRVTDLQRMAPDFDFGGATNAAHASSDILTEDIDQAILHFTAAVKERNQPVITRTVLFMNEALVSAAWRSRRHREEDGGAYGAYTLGLGGRGHSGSDRLHSCAPSLTQWVDALESLTAAALPTALHYLRDLYQVATTWTPEDRRSSLAVLNLVFFTLVLCRHTQRRVVILEQQRQHHRRMQQRRSAAASPSSTIIPFLFDASHPAPPLPPCGADGAALDEIKKRVEALYGAQQTCVVRYLCFIAWNAETQLHAIKVRASVTLKGVPSLAELPQVPLYLSEHDGWVWVWMVATLFSSLRLHRGADASVQVRASAPPSAAAAPASGWASPATTSAGSPPPANNTARTSGPRSASVPVVDVSSAAAAAAAARAAAPSMRLNQRENTFFGAAASSVEEPLGAAAGGAAAAGASPPVRSAAVRLLLQLAAHDGGDLYVHKLVSVMLSSFELYVHHWTRGQPVVGDLLREWTQRIVHSRLSSHVAALSRLYALFDRVVAGALEELTRVVVTLDDVVIHASFLFFASTRPLLRLHQLLEQLVPLQVTLLLLYQLHPEAHRTAHDDDGEEGEATGDYRFPDDIDDAFSSGPRSRQTERRRRAHDAGAEAVLDFCAAVSQLLAHVAELLLEPHTQRTNGFNAFQLPQSLCAAMLKNTMMFMASEILLNEDFWVSVRGGRGTAAGAGAGAVSGAGAATASGGGGGNGGRGGGAAMRKQWRWWAVWTNTAHFVCVTGGRFGESEESDADLLHHQRRRDVFYVQAMSLALEDVYALLQMTASTEAQQTAAAPRTLHLIFQRLRLFFVRLHEEHLAAISLHVVSPFSALRDDTFNAFAQLLEHYVAVTAVEEGPLRTPSPSLSGAGLLRGSAAAPTPLAHATRALSAPPHRSLWLLAVAYLRLATIDASSTLDTDDHQFASLPEQRVGDTKPSARRQFLSTHNFVCATPFVSLFYLRDRSYESSEDWMQQINKWQNNILSRSGTEVPQLRDSAHLFRCYRGEVQQTEDAARELLLLASVRLLAAALRAATQATSAEEVERLNRSSSSFTHGHQGATRGTESQASVYVTAFSRYLCMLNDISSPCLMFLLQSIREELRSCKEREASQRPSNASAATGEGNSNWLGEQDVLDARAFEWEVSLYSV